MPNLTNSLALLGAAALVVSVSACQKYQEAAAGGNAAGPADTSAVVDAIKADEKAWNEQFHAKNLDGLLGHYADGAVAVFPDAPSVTGDGMRKAFEGALKDPNFDVTFGADKIDTSGDLAYARGHFTEKYTDPKTKQVATNAGTYVAVYRKQADGSWKVVEDITAIEPPAGATASLQ